MIIICPVDHRTLDQFEEAVRDAVTYVSGTKFDHNILIADTPGTAFSKSSRFCKGKFHLVSFRPDGVGSRTTPSGGPSRAAAASVYTAVMQELIKRFPLSTITVGRVKYFYDRNRKKGRYFLTYQDNIESEK